MSEQKSKQRKSTDTETYLGKKIALTLLFCVSGILLLTCVVILWSLGSQGGREWLANTGLGLANRSAALNVQIENLQSPSLGEWRFDELDVKINGKQTLLAKGFTLLWFPKELFNKKIHIQSISSQKIDVHLNASETVETEEKEQTAGEFSLPSLPHIQLEAFDFPEINIHRTLSENVNNNAQGNKKLIKSLENFALSGNFLLPESQLLQLNVQAETKSKRPLTLSIESTVSNTKNKETKVEQALVNIKGELNEAAGGDLGALLQFPSSQAVNANLDLQVLPSNNKLTFTLNELSFDIANSSVSKKVHRINLSTVTEIDTSTMVTAVNDIILHVNKTKHTGFASWDGQQVQAQLKLNTFPLDIVSIWFEPIKSGNFSGTLKAKGKPESLQWSADTKLATQYNQVPINLAVKAQGNLQQFTIQTFDLRSNDSRIQASGKIDLVDKGSAVKFSIVNLNTDLVKKLKLPVPDSIPLDSSSLTIIKASGNISGELTYPDASITAEFKGNYEGQEIDGEFLIEKSGDALSISELSLAANDASSFIDGTINLKSLAADLNLSISKLPLQLLTLTGLQIPETLIAELTANGNFNGSLEPNKIVDAVATGHIATSGQFDDLPFDIKIDLSQSEGASKLESLIVTVLDEQVLNANGALIENTFEFNLKADDLPVRLLEAINIEKPRGQFSAVLSGNGQLDDLQNSVNINGNIQYNRRLASLNDEENKQLHLYTFATNIKTLEQENDLFSSSKKTLQVKTNISRRESERLKTASVKAKNQQLSQPNNKRPQFNEKGSIEHTGEITAQFPLDTYLTAILKKKTFPA